MLLWFPQKIYNKIKNNSEYQSLISELNSVMLDGSFNSIIWEKNKKAYDIYTKIKNLIEQAPKNELEQLYWEINSLQSGEYENSISNPNLNVFSIDQEFSSDILKQKLFEIKNKINLLEENEDKKLLLIYFLESKKSSIIIEKSFLSEELLEIRKEIVDIFKSIQKNNLDEETILIYFQNFFELFFIEKFENIENLSHEQSRNLFYYFKNEIESQIEEQKSYKLQSNNYRLHDYLEYEKMNFIKQFYDKLVNRSTASSEERLKLDREIHTFFNKNQFKYKNFSLIELHFHWLRMKNFFDHDNKDKFILIYEEICNYIKTNLKNKKYVIDSLNYFTYSDHVDFLIFLKKFIDFENIICEKYKKEKKLVDLNLTSAEIDLMNNQIINQNNIYNINLSNIESKLNG